MKAQGLSISTLIGAGLAVFLLIVGAALILKLQEAGKKGVETFTPPEQCSTTGKYYDEYLSDIKQAIQLDQQERATQLRNEALSCFPDKEAEIVKL